MSESHNGVTKEESDSILNDITRARQNATNPLYEAEFSGSSLPHIVLIIWQVNALEIMCHVRTQLIYHIRDSSLA